MGQGRRAQASHFLLGREDVLKHLGESGPCLLGALCDSTVKIPVPITALGRGWHFLVGRGQLGHRTCRFIAPSGQANLQTLDVS